MAKRKPITVERFVSIDGGETYKRWEEYTGEEKVKNSDQDGFKYGS